MACTVSDFRTRLPEYSDNTEYPDPRIQLFLDDAAEDIGSDENRWCGKYNRAHCYLGAHLLLKGTATEVGDTSSSSGSISSKSAGGVSVGRAVVAKDRSDLDDFYASTSYGQQFLSIRNTCLVGVLIAN
tara:strand:+ start:17206 stop:17592 length:387 start_codon:yes stop_codon:yes gene_type:complete